MTTKNRITGLPTGKQSQFQIDNCAKGCRFADMLNLKFGLQCCTFAFKLNIENGKCNTRR